MNKLLFVWVLFFSVSLVIGSSFNNKTYSNDTLGLRLTVSSEWVLNINNASSLLRNILADGSTPRKGETELFQVEGYSHKIERGHFYVFKSKTEKSVFSYIKSFSNDKKYKYLVQDVQHYKKENLFLFQYVALREKPYKKGKNKLGTPLYKTDLLFRKGESIIRISYSSKKKFTSELPKEFSKIISMVEIKTNNIWNNRLKRVTSHNGVDLFNFTDVKIVDYGTFNYNDSGWVSHTAKKDSIPLGEGGLFGITFTYKSDISELKPLLFEQYNKTCEDTSKNDLSQLRPYTKILKGGTWHIVKIPQGKNYDKYLNCQFNFSMFFRNEKVIDHNFYFHE